MLTILLKVRTGMNKWVFHTKEAIFYMAHLEQAKAHSLKLLLAVFVIQSVSSIAQIKLMISNLILC